MKKILRMLVYIVLLSIGPLSAFLLIPASVSYRITERYALTTSQPDVGVHLAVMVPKSGPYQTVENVSVDWPGDEIRESQESFEVIKLNGIAGEDGALEAVLTYDLTLRQGKVKWDASVSDEHLAPEREIESDAPILVTKAAEIGGDPSRKSAYQIYQFTAHHLSWPTGVVTGGNQSALAAYETGIGVCGEHANLMTALCRASGIPAKSISGLFLPPLLPPYMAQTRTWSHPGGAHAWVEIYAEDGWEMVDPTRATNSPLDRLLFGRIFGQHLSYGDKAQQDRVHNEMMVWGKSRGEMTGAMSAPLKFVAVVAEEDATISPMASVKKRQDVRWFTGIGTYIALLVAFSLLERRYRGAKA